VNSRLPIPEPTPGTLDQAGVVAAFAQRMMYTVAKDAHTATDFDAYMALSYAVRDRLMERWFKTQSSYYQADAKRVYYLSLEFLMGRTLLNNVVNLGAREAHINALQQLGYDLEALQDCEWDAGLGNGGLGRLAACFLDSAATLALPFYGYGIRYEYGIFHQHIQNGAQVETPDNWLRYGNPWEIPRPDALFPVHFYGRTEYVADGSGHVRARWVDTQDVWAMAYDTPIAGFGNDTVNTLRLWSAKSSREFDLRQFNRGDYVSAVQDKTSSENISKVLYPPDDQPAGRELRLKQQYFFVTATLQDVMRRFLKFPGRSLSTLPEKVAIQLNDTHPVLGIPELMRILVDEHRLPWDEAWDLTTRVFGYTNHTVLPEALERWPVDLFRRLLPRHFEIVYEIDRRFRAHVQGLGDAGLVERTAILDARGNVHMAHLGFVGSHAVNGVAALHTDILRTRTFADLDRVLPGRIANRTNGITPRRWLLQSNPALASLITEAIGTGWTRDLEELRRLTPFADDAAFRKQWAEIKRRNKGRLADRVRKLHDLELDPETMFDCQVKRFHEYKRQLLNALHAIALHERLRDGDTDGFVPRTIIFAGKAAPGYAMAKLIIQLIHAIAWRIEADPVTRGRLRVVFLPNYSVSLAELIFPACDLSEQISTAGTEASGTGNMKAALNGALTIGTLDGANVEIRDEVGAENILIFGRTTEEIEALRRDGTPPSVFIERSAALRRAIDLIGSGELDDHSGLFLPIAETLRGADRYFHCADFEDYVACQQRAAALYADKDAWGRLSILNVAGMGAFSSDRTIRQYAEGTWGAVPVPVQFL
jgi:starch phosphorylase